jgi:hypothetical protein
LYISRGRRAVGRKPKGGTRQNVRIDQRKLDRVRKELGVETETEAIERALDAVVLRVELREALDEVGCKFPDWRDPYGADEEGLEFRIPPLEPDDD